MAELNTKLAALLFPVVLVGAMKALDATAGGAASLSPLVAELTARAAGTPVKEAASAAGSGPGGPVRPSTRASVVAAAVVALVAITATTYALARDEAAPRTAPEQPSTTGTTVDPTPSPTPTATTAPATPTTPSQLEAPSAPTAAPPTVPTGPVPTTPSAPAPSVPGVPVPNTPGPPPTTPPTTPTPTTPDPQPTVVRPSAPAAAPITRCDSYGSLRIPRTVGVRYTLAAGDGRQGAWTVTATAAEGYAIAKGAPRRFTGDLGRYHACPPPLAIREVATTHTGSHADDPWQVTVTPTAPDQERRALTVSYWFDTQVVVLRRLGDGWTCRGPGGADITEGPFAARSRLTCAFAERGQQPPPLSLVVRARNGSGTVVPPSGTVSLAADGDVIDVEDFDSVDR